MEYFANFKCNIKNSKEISFNSIQFLEFKILRISFEYWCNILKTLPKFPLKYFANFKCNITKSKGGFRLIHFNFWNLNFYESFPNIGGIYYENSIKIPMEYFTILQSQKWIHLNSFQFLDFQILRIAFEYCRNIWKTPEQQNKLLFFLPLSEKTNTHLPAFMNYIHIYRI